VRVDCQQKMLGVKSQIFFVAKDSVIFSQEKDFLSVEVSIFLFKYLF
jgi:hypothetical protein